MIKHVFSLILAFSCLLGTNTFAADDLENSIANVGISFDKEYLMPGDTINISSSFKNDFSTEKFTLICALYNGNRLVNVKTVERSIAKGETDTISMAYTVPSDINPSYVLKAFLWENFSNAKPIFASAMISAKYEECTLDKLQTEYLYNPIGIDVARPRFSWNILSDIRGQVQTAYQILVGTSADKLNEADADVWNSGKKSSNASCNVEYDGPALRSKTRYYWKVRIWDKNGRVSKWSEAAFFETAMLDPSDWAAEWITPMPVPQVDIAFDPIEARYVKLDATKLGIQVPGENVYRLQLAEFQIFEAGTNNNVALGCSVTSNKAWTNANWDPSYLVDGEIQNSSKLGFTTSELGSIDTNVWVQIDLGSVKTIDRISLFPRNDIASKIAGKAASFPSCYTIAVATDGSFKTVYTASNADAPDLRTFSGLPIIAKSFYLDKQVKSARAYVSGLGLFEMSINGKKATDALFEPGETNFDKKVFYVTYDITDKLFQGENAVGIYLGKGFYYNPVSPGRYNRSPKIWGPLMVMAQLEIEYVDGSRKIVSTDNSWKTTVGPITDSVWLGGEDYDARKEKEGFDRPGYDYSGWESVSIVKSLPFDRIEAKMYPSLRIVGEVPVKTVTNPSKGTYVVDFGMNFAGIYEFAASQPAGTKVEFWPAENLNADGTINQDSTGGPIYDTYTFKGNGIEKYRPKFVYHGFRYLQIKGMATPPSEDMFRGYIVRCDNEPVGEFATSNSGLNQIHKIIKRSISDNMYNVCTDCPHREKLGWMEVPNLLYNTIANNYDVAAWMQKISNDMIDAQKDYGSVPSIVPPLTVGHTVHALRSGPDDTPNDPTWCGSVILVPWYSYKTYGNLRQLQKAYDSMNRYMDYLGSLAEKNEPYILESGDLNRDLGDWCAIDAPSVTLVVSCTYYQLADVMSQISTLLGDSSNAQKYAALAQNIKNAINSKFLNTSTMSYDNGSQSSNAIPLFLKIVPPEYEQGVLQSLIEAVKKKDYHLSTGEVGLRPLLDVLSDYGYSDIAYSIVTNKTMPGYGYFVSLGKTSLPETWSGGASQNHAMMGHGDGWLFEYLGGIRNNGIGYDRIIIDPYIPKDLISLDVSINTRYGRVRNSWTRNGDYVTMNVSIPVNTKATVCLPTNNINTITLDGASISASEDVLSYKMNNGKFEVEIGSGNYSFRFSILQILDTAKLQGAVDAYSQATSTNTISNFSLLQTAVAKARTALDTALTQREIDDALESLMAVARVVKYKNIALGKPTIVSPTSITIDLLVDSPMNRVEINHTDEFPKAFTLEVSKDGEVWQEVFKQENYKASGSSKQSLTFGVVWARYLRFSAAEVPKCTIEAYCDYNEANNLALYKTVTASSSLENADWSKSKITDGNRTNQGTGYTSVNNLFSNHAEWVLIDMGSINNISRMDVYPRYFSTQSETFPEAFTIEVSNDGQSWTKVLQSKYYPLAPYGVQRLEFERVSARYVRFTADSIRPIIADGSRYRLQIAEIELYDVAR